MLSVSVGMLLLLLAVGIPVAAAMIVLGLLLAGWFSPMPLWIAFGELTWGTSSSFTLFAIPLYILLGELLLRSGISEKMYHAIAQWLARLPGGLMHANVGFSTAFAAMSGSSVACAATLGTIANPMIKRYRYNEPLFLGTIAAGGSLGILIPPSIPLIIYGVLTETSIPKLYLAAMLPGVLLAVLFSTIILVCCLVRPAWGGQALTAAWRRRWEVLPDLLPPLSIFILVIGAIYVGWATPSESAALGVLMALALAVARRRFTIKMLLDAAEATMTTTAMILLIVIGAFLLNFVLTAIGLSSLVTHLFSDASLSPTAVLLTAVVFYLVLGMFMEPLSMLIATVPLIIPAIKAAGIDPLMFGVLMMVLMETAMLTPPVGINLFVVQGTRESGKLKDVVYGALPFVVTMLAMIGLLVFFPSLTLWLPGILS
ncbi:TRAP transporter large permease [Castellaniella sp. GW247-6E4]|uniref:TRAP transporter large permease n=1 Tax=Castellaniella sp. GW247-6E4 TaxID=3140380 RepID=UPI003315B640